MSKYKAEDILFKSNRTILADIKLRGDEEMTEDALKNNKVISEQLKNLTSNEYKLFNQILIGCQISKFNDNSFVSVINYEKVKGLFGRKENNTPKGIFNVLEKFVATKITFPIDEKNIVVTNMINSVVADTENLIFTCYINKYFYEIATNYKEYGYSPINTRLLNNVKKYYTQRLYELLRMWSGTKKNIYFELDELKKYLGADNVKSYSNFSNFEIKVLKPAICEIKKYMYMDVNYSLRRKGLKGKVLGIDFIVLDNETRNYDLRSDKKKEYEEGRKKQKTKGPKFNNFKGREYTDKDYKTFEDGLSVSSEVDDSFDLTLQTTKTADGKDILIINTIENINKNRLLGRTVTDDGIVIENDIIE